jgi:hypothetical protein
VADDISIVIGAQDKASKVINDVVKNADAKLKQFKTVAASGKASAELTGTLAKTLGGTALGAFSGELAGITERISAFSEVSQQGAGGALAFKAGLAGVAAVAGFKIGTMIGDWVFETEKFTAQLAKANVELLKAADLAATLQSTKLGIATAKIELIDDPEEQDAALRKRFTELSRMAEQQQKNIELIKEEQQARLTGWQSMLGVSEEVKAANEAEVQAAAKSLAAIENEQAKIGNKLNREVQELEALKKAKQDAAESERKQIAETEAAKKKAQDDEQRAAEKKIADAQRLSDMKDAEFANLERQRILLNQGKEAAQAFALEQKGLDEATAKRIASEQAAIDKAVEEKNSKSESFTPGIQATESRLLTRGPAEKGIDKIATNTEKMVTEIREVNRAITELDYKGAHAPEAVTVG